VTAAEVRDTGAKEIAEYVKSSSMLTMLDVQVNKLGDEGKQALRDAVKGRGVLREGFKLLV